MKNTYSSYSVGKNIVKSVVILASLAVATACGPTEESDDEGQGRDPTTGDMEETGTPS